VVSCRNPDRERLAAELFGAESRESGDAKALAQGALERVRSGTLLLDEVGGIPLDLQVTLAKALTKHAPAGQAAAVRWTARLMCTTSRDLKGLMENGAFLRELYYQINILPIEIPPLGRRREDIPLLVSHFLEQASEPGGQRKIYSPKAIELLATTDWPGNVRQLFDIVKQNVALSHGDIITKEFVENSLGADLAKIPTYDEARDQFARDYLAENLQRTAGNVTQAARLAKRSRTDFYKLLARYRLNAEDFKNAESTGRKDKNDESRDQKRELRDHKIDDRNDEKYDDKNDDPTG